MVRGASHVRSPCVPRAAPDVGIKRSRTSGPSVGVALRSVSKRNSVSATSRSRTPIRTTTLYMYYSHTHTLWPTRFHAHSLHDTHSSHCRPRGPGAEVCWVCCQVSRRGRSWSRGHRAAERLTSLCSIINYSSISTIPGLHPGRPANPGREQWLSLG